MKKIVVFSIVVIITLLLISSAKVPEHNEQGYKIKVIKDTIDGKNIEEKIIFVSPDGEIIKSMKKYRWDEEMKVNEENGKYNIYTKRIETISENNAIILMYESNYQLDCDPKEYRGKGATKYTNEVKIINARGEEKSLNTVQAYNNNLLGFSFFETDISKDGSIVYIYYMDSTKIYHIEIYDTTGNQLTATTYPKVFELEKQISPDGNIFGATAYGEEGKLLYFLNTETGEVKICKAEGEGWISQFSLPPEGGTPLGKISIRWGIYEDLNNKKWVKGGHKYLYFNEIPLNISELFEEEQ